MSTANYKFKEVVQDIIDEFVAGSVYTQMPAIITDVSQFEDKQVVSVRPMVNRTHGSGEVVVPPPSLNCPVIFAGGGGGVMTFPLAKDDRVLLVYAMRSLTDWKGLGTPNEDTDSTTPRDKRHHSMTDAIVIPGLETLTSHGSPNINDVEIKYKGATIRIMKNGDIDLDTTTKVNILAASDVNITSATAVNIVAPVVNINP